MREYAVGRVALLVDEYGVGSTKQYEQISCKSSDLSLFTEAELCFKRSVMTLIMRLGTSVS